MPLFAEIIEFIKDLAGTDEIEPDSDIFEIGMVGDDFHEMIEKYAKKYSVNMTSYLWYFHTDEEGFGSLGGLFFDPPYKRVKRIPVTPAMLADFANKGQWVIQYPDHKIPKRRYDLLINKYFFILILIYVAIAITKKCIGFII
jgi:hypothetical protein